MTMWLALMVSRARTLAAGSWSLRPPNSHAHLEYDSGSLVDHLYGNLTSDFIGVVDVVEGRSVTFAVILHTRPISSVVVDLEITGGNFMGSIGAPDVSWTPSRLVIKPQDWREVHPITLFVPEDNVTSTAEMLRYQIEITAISQDTAFTGQANVLKVALTVHDNDIFCPPGHYRYISHVQVACLECPEDTFRDTPGAAGVAECWKCDKHRHTYGLTGATSKNDCECDTGRYPSFSEKGGKLVLASCNPCPEGAVCKKPIIGNSENRSTDPELWLHGKAGYWDVPWSPSFKRCKHTGTCLEGGKCAPHNHGPLCSICDDYYQRSSNGECTSCSRGTSYTKLYTFIGIFVLNTGLIYWKRKKLRKFRNAWRDFLRVFKIILDYWQVNSSMPTVLAVDFPTTWTAWLSTFDFVNLDIADLVNLNCIPGYNYVIAFGVTCSFPVFAVVTGYVAFAINKCRHDKKKKERVHRTPAEIKGELLEGLKVAFHIADADNSGLIDAHEFGDLVRRLGHKKFTDKMARKMFQKKTKDGDAFLSMKEFLTIVLDPHNKVHIDIEVISWSKHRRQLYKSIAFVSQLLLLVHTPVTRKFFQVLNCKNIDGRRFIQVDMQVDCDSSEYLAGVIPAIAVGTIFVFGFPFCIGLYLCIHRKDLYAVSVMDKIGFLYDRFHKNAEFWE